MDLMAHLGDITTLTFATSCNWVRTSSCRLMSSTSIPSLYCKAYFISTFSLVSGSNQELTQAAYLQHLSATTPLLGCLMIRRTTPIVSPPSMLTAVGLAPTTLSLSPPSSSADTLLRLRQPPPIPKSGRLGAGCWIGSCGGIRG